MRRNQYWGLALLLIGLLLLLDNLGFLTFLGVSVWQILWSLALISLGVWVLVAGKLNPAGESRDIAVELENATEADIQLEYGAGELRIDKDSEAHNILSGTCVGGVKHSVQRQGSLAKVQVSSPAVFTGPHLLGLPYNRRWDIRLTDRIPIALTLKTGASDCTIDLKHLRITALNLESGASSTTVILPENAGHTEVRGSSGAASVTLKIPEGVSARIYTQGGLSSTSVNQRRFPRQGNIYISPDYEIAGNRVDIRLDMGVGSIDIK